MAMMPCQARGRVVLDDVFPHRETAGWHHEMLARGDRLCLGAKEEETDDMRL